MTVLLIFLSVLPCLLILYYIYKRDKHERENLNVYLFCLLFGILSSCLAYYVEPMAKAVFEPDRTQLLFSLKIFVGIALSEELCKYIFLLLMYRNREFNEPYDGIVYAVLIAVGFAMVENILYVVPLGSLKVALERMVTAVPAHAVFGGIMGWFFGMAKFSKKYTLLLIIAGALVSAFLHGVYDYFIFMEHHPKWIWISLALLIVLIIYTRWTGNMLRERSPYRKDSH